MRALLYGLIDLLARLLHRPLVDPGEFSATSESDLNIIRIGQERYEIPDAVVSGG